MLIQTITDMSNNGNRLWYDLHSTTILVWLVVIDITVKLGWCFKIDLSARIMENLIRHAPTHILFTSIYVSYKAH